MLQLPPGEDMKRIGVEIRRRSNESWRELVHRYASLRNASLACLVHFDNLVETGHAPPRAALETLFVHGCTDVIVEAQHLTFGEVVKAN